MKQVLYRRGEVYVQEVPAPMVEPGTVLVRVDHSCISVGTELSGISSSGVPLYKRVLQQPQNVKRVLNIVAEQGLARARSMVDGVLSAGQPIGYAAAGTVLEVGAGVDAFRPGDRVACAGAQCAFHAEVIRVPVNLVVAVPDALSFAEASTLTLGAIAMQGVRRASPTLGETFVVIGLGILGQLTSQLLRTNGCRVIGIELDSGRATLASELGMEMAVDPGSEGAIERVAQLTAGVGADGVIITAATSSDEVISQAFKLCRKKGRVVLVGDVGLHLNRHDFYLKEIDFLISTSYGPGRYDRSYEEEGLDYPVAYVRWTENRNLEEYIRLLSERRVTISRLIDAVYPVSEAPDAYRSLASGSKRPMMVLLSYPSHRDGEILRRVPNPSVSARTGHRIGVAVVGAGGFAKASHLPNIAALREAYDLRAVVSRSGHNASAAARQFNAAYSATDYAEVLRDPSVDAVIIATRHDLHARMALQALRHGKHVYLEKPMALTQAENDEIAAFFEQAGNEAPLLLTGYNRRFSAYATRARQLIRHRTNPMIINYRMNAGYIPLDHWVHGREGGGRNLGEACHIYDLFTFLTEARVTSIGAQALDPRNAYYGRRDNFVATLGFDDGSVATLTYTALGSRDYAKEHMEVYCDGKVIRMDDYRQLSVFGARHSGLRTKHSAKGQKEALEAFAHAVRSGSGWPVPLWQQLQVADTALRVNALL